LDQARHNERLFGLIDRNRFSDWAVTLLFYAALQYIDAYLATQGEHDPGGHDVREDLIRRDKAIRDVLPQYLRLKSFSRTARYYAGRFTPFEIEGLKRGSFEPIKARVETLLTPRAPGRT
jgi:hypothetical protein